MTAATNATVRVELTGAGSAAWNHDWRPMTVTAGTDVAHSEESPETRERIRDVARARLAGPAGDAFLAEILAAEPDY